MADTDMPDADSDSDVSDVFEPWTPPSDQLRTYTVVRPPQLPEWTSIDGTDYKTRWYDDSWRYTARAYASAIGIGFEVRQMNITARDDPEPEDPGNRFWWPPKYALGAPNDIPAVWQPLLGHWGFPLLEKAGFLNYYPDDDSPGDKNTKPLGRLAGKRNPSGKTRERIHPVLRMDMWNQVDDDEYELMEPALLMASAILDDPATLAFFHAVADQNSMTQFHDATHGPCLVASVPTTLTEQQQTEVYNKVIKMRDWTTYQFAYATDMATERASGVTKVRRDANKKVMLAGQAHTSQSTIHITDAYIEVLERFRDDEVNDTNEHGEHLEGWFDRFNVPLARRPHTLYPDSAYDRTVFNFADTLVHEFAHAFSMAYYPVPPSQTHKTPEEPWIQGNRSNELGCALINHLFGGIAFATTGYACSGLTEHQHFINCPFGMYVQGQWDLWTEDDRNERVTTASIAAVATSKQTAYPIPQKYFHHMHTEETWKQQVPRFGLAAIRLPRLKEWSMTFKHP